MKGYTVITSDEKKAGHVVDEQGDYLIVEHGTIFKSRRPLPRAFAHADESEEIVGTTVPYAIIDDAPEIGDDEAIARHYGLAGPDPDPVTHGYGDVLPDDPSEPAEDHVAERATMREHMGPGEGANDRGSSIGITGGDRFRDAKRP